MVAVSPGATVRSAAAAALAGHRVKVDVVRMSITGHVAERDIDDVSDPPPEQRTW